MEHKNPCTFIIIISFLILNGCSLDSLNGSRARRITSDPAPVSTEQSVSTPEPELVIDNEIRNCKENDKCHLEEIKGIEGVNVSNTYYIPSLIVADTDIMVSSNIAESPAIRFGITNIETQMVKEVSFYYQKKDSMGKLLTETKSYPVYLEDDSYTVPIHSSTLGSGILISAPYEKHILNIKIETEHATSYYKSIEFYLLTNMTDPIKVDRDPEIQRSKYYTMENSSDGYIVDSIFLENILPFPVTSKGSINISNKTIAMLSNTKKDQKKLFVPKADHYLWDRYKWYTEDSKTYNMAIAHPIYSVKIHKGQNTVEEIPIKMEPSSDGAFIIFDKIDLLANEKILLEIEAGFNENSSLTGGHGELSFFEGLSLCSNISIPDKCSCFYMPKKLPATTESVFLYFLPGQLMGLLAKEYYPDCKSITASVIEKGINIVPYPEKTLALVGRYHRTNTKYNFQTWLKGYEDYNAVGTVTKDMDTLESTKGYVDEAIVDPTLSYEGYVPGEL